MTVALYTENSPRLPVSLGEFHGYSGTLRRALQSDPLFDAYSGQLKKLAVRYGINPVVVYPHSFRHRFAKSFLERCNDIAFLADLMGHESIER